MTEAATAPGDFILDLEGFEGPIDLLLSLAREQKVDLARISILALAEQYLAFIRRARDLKLEIAADYLVTAAWLAYLKSRLLLPAPPDDDEEPSAEVLAENLAWRLRHLDAVRRAGEQLFERPCLGRERLARGRPEGVAVLRRSRFRMSLHELLEAYVDQRLRASEHRLVVARAPAVRVEEALARICALLGGPDWQNLLGFLPPGLLDDAWRRSAIAASFAAALELAREGLIELSQAGPFGPIYVRRKR